MRAFIQRVLHVSIAGLIGTSAGTAAWAQHSSPPPSSEDEIRSLRQEMNRLQQRIEQLEKSSAEGARPAGTAPTGTAATNSDSPLPAWLQHFKVGTQIYGDWAYYPKTGWGPQFLTQLNPPRPWE